MPQENLPAGNTIQKKILVTGGAGLVGNELIKQLLAEGEDVRAIYHATPLSLSHPDLDIVQCDILDVVDVEESMKGITHVYHSAALVSYAPQDRQQLLKINVEGTANVVNACIQAGIEKLVHVSSVAALGRAGQDDIISENMNWTEETSNSMYGKSKYFAEMEVWRGIGEGLKAVIVNPTLILGGDSWESGSSAIFKKAYDEFKWHTNGITGFVDVRDVARAMILLMNSQITAQRFILNGENLSYKEVFSSIATCFGKKPPYKEVTSFMAELIWRIESIKAAVSGSKSLLTKETARTALSKVRFDNSKIVKALPGFEFTKIQETIAYTCSALKDNYRL